MSYLGNAIKKFLQCMKKGIIYSPYEGIPDVELLNCYSMFLENADDDSDERQGFQLT